MVVFLNMVWQIAKDKTANTILRTLKQFFAYHGCPEILKSDNEKELLMILLPIIYKANTIKFIHRRPYHTQSQGSVEEFNKIYTECIH